MTTPAKAAADAAKASAPGVNQPPADPPEAIKPQIAHYLGLVRAIETELREALILVSERHERNYDISRGAATLATWSTEHLEWLEQPIVRYGAAETDGPAKLRAALLGGTRVGVIGELADIADLAVLVEQASMAWTILTQGAKELHDKALIDVATEAREHSRRQLAWLRTQIEHEAPDAIAVAHDAKGQAKMSIPARPADLASIPDMAWGPVAAGGLLLAVGALSLLIGKPWLLPSLGPTAVLLAVQPAHPTARVWNTFVGHIGGLVAGFAGILLFGAMDAPSVLTDGQIVLSRVLAASFAVAVTVVVGELLNAQHPPAAATAMLVAFGSLATLEKALWLVAGAASIAVLGEGVRRLRLQRTTPAERRAPSDGITHARLRTRARS